MTEDKKTHLLSKEATGGDTAEGGFTFQAYSILARIPAWLSCDGFTDMIREGLGDAEARFLSPGSDVAREFIEYKNHSLTPSVFWPEIEQFRSMDTAYPNAYWRFVLVCSGLSDSLHPMLNALRRVREAFPFYSDAPSVLDASYAAFEESVLKLEQDKAMAQFLFHKVVIDPEAIRNPEQGFNTFRATLEHHFPEFADLSQNAAKTAWQALTTLVNSRKCKPILRSELRQAMWSGVATPPPDRLVCLNTSNSPFKRAWDIWPEDIHLDWSDFSGGEHRAYPDRVRWDELISQLKGVKDWFKQYNRPQRIKLQGHRRLSSSVALGSVLSSVSGFSIDIALNEALWSTDAHPNSETPEYDWQVVYPESETATDLAVVIGIGRKPVAEVEAYLSTMENSLPILSLHCSDALTSPMHANLAVKAVKDEISLAISNTGASTIHLFLAVPSFFAIFLGHRLNATAQIQCYERIRPNHYQATCFIAAT